MNIAPFIYRLLSLLFVAVLVGCDNTPSDKAYKWPLREGFPKPQVPKNNPMTEEKVKLGRHLFYDKNLSFNQTQSCATCHIQKYAFAETKKQSTGSTGQQHRRNAPALVNIAYNKTLTWAHNGLNDIETQLLLPMFGESPVELGITGHEDDVLARFNTPLYSELFKRAFPEKGLSFNSINQALSSFVRSLISLNSPFDRYAYDGDDNALSASALNGMTLFFSEKFECHHCHGGFNFTQSTFHEKQLLDRRPFHNTGLYNANEKGQYPLDNGLYEVTLDDNDHGRFRAPTLRNIEVTAPYMHDGSIETLEQVIEFYAAGGRLIEEGPHKGDGRKNPLKSPFVKGFELSEEEKNDLIAFMQSLTDQQFLISKKHAKPAQLTETH